MVLFKCIAKQLNKSELKRIINKLKSEPNFLSNKEKEKVEDILTTIENLQREDDQLEFLAQIVYQMRAKMLYNEFMEKIIPLTGFTFENPPLPTTPPSAIPLSAIPLSTSNYNTGSTSGPELIPIPAPSPGISRAETMEDLRKPEPFFVEHLQKNIRCAMTRESLKTVPNKDIITACFIVLLSVESLKRGEPLSNVMEIVGEPEGKILFKGDLLSELQRHLQPQLIQVGLSSNTLNEPLDKDTLQTIVFLVAKRMCSDGTANWCGSCKLSKFPGLMKAEN